MRKLKDFISTFETEIVKLFKKYEVVQGCFKHKPVSSCKLDLWE